MDCLECVAESPHGVHVDVFTSLNVAHGIRVNQTCVENTEKVLKKFHVYR